MLFAAVLGKILLHYPPTKYLQTVQVSMQSHGMLVNKYFARTHGVLILTWTLVVD